LKESGLNPESFKRHLEAFDFGMPPHAGWAIGLERLTMMLTGKKNIREVVLYPRDKFRLAP
jgi:aspartyl-tRNA synthetase